MKEFMKNPPKPKKHTTNSEFGLSIGSREKCFHAEVILPY